MVAFNSDGPLEASRLARADIATAIADSFRRRVGGFLVPTNVEGGPLDIDQALMTSSSVILCHDGTSDPHFIFANHAAAALWRMEIEDLVGMPSRLSAPPQMRADRAQALAQAAIDGVLIGYSGERVAADGSRFVIVDATLWTVDLPKGLLGQAVVFDTWHELPGPEESEGIR